MTLIQCLLRLSTIWAEAAGHKSTSRLATIVANDGKLLSRLEAGGGTCTVATFEKFLAFFREPGNWPESILPADAADILDEIKGIAVGGDPVVGHEVQLEACLVSHKPTDTETPPEQSAGKCGGSTGKRLAPEAEAA